MSSVSIETLTKGYAALAARDEEALMSCLAEDVELQTLTGAYRGHEGIRQWIADMDDGWHPWELTVEGIEEVGERVVVEATLTGHSSVNDIPMSHPFWIVWEVRDGRAARAIHCADGEQALMAARSARRTNV
jgi:ketosteroid isomerase-like protein